MRIVFLLGAVAALTVGLAGCDGKSSAVASRDQSPWSGASAGSNSSSGATAAGGSASADPRDAPVPQINGKPMWAANRKHTAEDNAQYQYTKNGGDFGAKDEGDYVTKVHAFVENPPSGAQTIDRPNGDKLIYDPQGNVFAVVSKTGAPRTMFKPRAGASYWAQQKDREAQKSKSSGGSDQS